jgi:hypothetical protein
MSASAQFAGVNISNFDTVILRYVDDLGAISKLMMLNFDA